jgi:hypothetical protein
MTNLYVWRLYISSMFSIGKVTVSLQPFHSQMTYERNVPNGIGWASNARNM